MRTKSNKTKLIENAKDGNLDEVVDLLRGGTNVNAKDQIGNTALMWASRHGHLDVVRALLNHEEVDVNIKNDNSCTALIDASFWGHLEVVRTLVRHDGVEVNIQNKYGLTALILASGNGNLELVRALLNHDGVEVNIVGALLPDELLPH